MYLTMFCPSLFRLQRQVIQRVELGLGKAILVGHHLHHLGVFVGDVEDADAVGVELLRSVSYRAVDELRCDLVCTGKRSLEHQEVASVDVRITVEPCPVFNVFQSTSNSVGTEFNARL